MIGSLSLEAEVCCVFVQHAILFIDPSSNPLYCLSIRLFLRHIVYLSFFYSAILFIHLPSTLSYCLSIRLLLRHLVYPSVFYSAIFFISIRLLLVLIVNLRIFYSAILFIHPSSIPPYCFHLPSTLSYCLSIRLLLRHLVYPSVF